MGTWIVFAQIALALAAGWMALIPLMASVRARRGLQRPSVLVQPVAPARRSGSQGNLSKRVTAE